MKSKTVEYKANYWRNYRASVLPYVVKNCAKCGQSFQPKGRQTDCGPCSVFTCATCGVEFPKRNGKSRRFCSRSCAAKQPHVLERLRLTRGKKPRTYLRNRRDKHGCAEDREWRLTVFKRDNFTCLSCGQVGGRLQADHIRSFVAYPELRHELSNGRTLCRRCHIQTPNYGPKARHEIAARRLAQEVLAL